MIGSTLSHYKITAELGRGGMGIVYRAEDTKLNRTVAVKVLPSAALATDDDRSRFYREARAAAQLHHAHIATVFEIDEATPGDAPHGTEPSPFIVMEFIEGETLHDRIEKGPLKLSDAIRIATEIASALDAAHEKDIVHRDIKSGNVMLTKKNEAKVLDFGLAKTAQSTKLTRMGSTLGTVAYMSPEQARGEEVDNRSDLYSLGTVLYEMIAGRLPFSAEYEQAAIYSILNEDPEPLTAVRTGVPIELEALVMKALRKDRELRYQTARDLIADLKAVDQGSGIQSRIQSTNTVATPGGQNPSSNLLSGKKRRNTIAAGILFATGIVLAFVTGRFFPASTADPSGQSALLITETIPDAWGGRISPDGRSIGYVARDTVWVRRLSASSANPVSRFNQNSRALFWSPNSNRIGFIDGDVVRTVRSDGSNEIRVGRLPPSERIQGVVWSPEDSIYVVVAFGGANAEIFSLPANGGNASSFMRLNAASNDFVITDIAWHDRTGSLIGAVYETKNGRSSAYVRLLKPSNANEIESDTALQEATQAESWYTSLAVDPAGYILLIRDRTLWVLNVDPESLQPTGTPKILLSGIASASVGANGLFVGERVRNTGSAQLVLFDPEYSTLDPVAPIESPLRYLAIKPDGKQAVGMLDGIYVFDLNRGDSRRIYSTVAAISEWLPDHLGISVSTYQDGTGADIFIMDPDGLNDLKTFIEGDESEFYTALSPDRTKTMYYVADPQTGRDLWVADVNVTDDEITLVGEPKVWYAGPNDDVFPAWHPSGNWILYSANHTGKYQVYTRKYPSSREEQHVSIGAGFDPAWSPDGKHIYYRDLDSLYVVDVQNVSTMTLSAPRGILEFDSNRISMVGTLTRSYAVHPITGQLLMSQYLSEPDDPALVMVYNWRALLADK